MIDEEVNHETFRDDNDCEESRNMEIWEDELNIMVLNVGKRNQGFVSPLYITIGTMIT